MRYYESYYINLKNTSNHPRVAKTIKGEQEINNFLRRNEGYFPVIKLRFFFKKEEKTIKVYQRPDLHIKAVYDGQNAPVGVEYQQILKGTYPSIYWDSLIGAYMVKKEWVGQEVFINEVIKDSVGSRYLGNRNGVRALFDGRDLQFLDLPDNNIYIG